MLISEITDPLLTELETFAASVKARFGLHDFSVWVGHEGAIRLNNLIATKQRQGAGTAAMEALCGFADQHGRRITLTPAMRDDHWGTTSRNRLIRFYKRFGFVENRGRRKDFTISDSMYREPRSA